jgi:hypothetical protein
MKSDNEMHKNFLPGNLICRDHFGDISLDGRIIFKLKCEVVE